MPQIITPDPFKIIPFHQVYEETIGIICDYIRGVFVPPIPLLEAPSDLKHLGDYVNYNGHHRTMAAKKVSTTQKEFKPLGILLTNQRDIEYLIDNPPVYNNKVHSEIIEGLGNNFKEHQEFIWNEARRFHKLMEQAKKLTA